MSQTQTPETAAPAAAAPDPQAADRLVVGAVTLPAFYAKLAADGGITPPDAQAAELYVHLADKVAFAVETAYDALLAPDASVKAAAAALGVTPPATQPAAAPDARAADVLALPGVRDALTLLTRGG